MVILHFCHDVITRRAAVPPVFDPLFFKKHSVINNGDILFKFRMFIVSIMGKVAVVLIYFFRVFAQSYPCCPRTFGTALVPISNLISS